MEASSDQKAKYKKILFLIGIVVAAALFLFTVYSFVRELKQILSEGRSSFLMDLLFRIIAGLLISLFNGLPYLIGGILTNLTKNPLYLFGVCIIISVIYIYEIIKITFFPSSSTDAVALVFLPFYFILLVLISWGVIKIVEKYTKTY